MEAADVALRTLRPYKDNGAARVKQHRAGSERV